VIRLLIDKRMMIVGMIMIILGVVILLYLTESAPIGKSGMTEDEKLNLLLAEQENSDYRTLVGILIGFGFLLVLISFGARRKRKGDAKKIEKKPLE
tara:strand:- start:231 stop:518 length:288 start_codon:yes stop_codon:yes gene_type:complete